MNEGFRDRWERGEGGFESGLTTPTKQFIMTGTHCMFEGCKNECGIFSRKPEKLVEVARMAQLALQNGWTAEAVPNGLGYYTIDNWRCPLHSGSGPEHYVVKMIRETGKV